MQPPSTSLALLLVGTVVALGSLFALTRVAVGNRGGGFLRGLASLLALGGILLFSGLALTGVLVGGVGIVRESRSAPGLGQESLEGSDGAVEAPLVLESPLPLEPLALERALGADLGQSVQLVDAQRRPGGGVRFSFALE